jgi:hypothetical protein
LAGFVVFPIDHNSRRPLIGRTPDLNREFAQPVKALDRQGFRRVTRNDRRLVEDQTALPRIISPDAAPLGLVDDYC